MEVDSAGQAAGVEVDPPELPVAVLADTTAALYEVARMAANYVGDYWSEAGSRVNRAADLLAEARRLLDACCTFHVVSVSPMQFPRELTGPAPRRTRAAAG